MKFIIIILSFLLLTVTSYSQENKKTDIEFTSDSLEVNEKKNLMIAKGNVVIRTQNETIKADQIIYDKNLDKAVATGKISIISNDGTIFDTSEITLTNEFKDILALTLFAQFKDNSKIKASKFIKTKEQNIFINGKYTPCDCDFKNDEEPIWQLNSSRIIHDINEKTIYFKNVILKIFDFPIFYFPFLSHPDPSVKRKSGFLTPTWSSSSRNGFQSSIPYYIAPSDESWDLTFTNHLKGKHGYVNQLNTRKKFNSGYLETNLFQGQVDTNNEDNDNVFAGNLNFNSRLESNWYVDVSGKYTDQDTFMKRYNFDNSLNYKNHIRMNKINNNSFSEIEWYKYQNLEVDTKNNQPNLQPSIKHKLFLQDHNIMSEISLSAHEIKNDEGYNIQRWSGFGILEHKVNSKFVDLILSTETGLDLYAIKNRPSTDTNDNKYLDRLSLGLSVMLKKDLFYSFGEDNIFTTPKVQISSMHSTDRKDDIPNRDSSDFRLDQTNLFLINPYVGRDNIQTSQRFNYGIDNFVSSNIGDFYFFFGQSHRIGGTNNNVLNVNLDRQSDFISELKWEISEKYNISYNTFLDHHNLKENYTSLELGGKLSDINYNFIHRSINKNIINDDNDREELKFSISKKLFDINLSYSATYDLNNNETDLINEEISLYYDLEYMFKDCLSINFTYNNNNASSDRDLIPEDSYFITLKFKNLGEYGLNSLF